MSLPVPRHLPEYLAEALGLALFMISAGAFALLLEHPASPARAALENPAARRLLMGSTMGLTALALVTSPFGRRSGAHLNPAVTLTYLRLGKAAPRDALAYALFQCAGGVAGLLLLALLGLPLSAVGHVATRPGPAGPLAAFSAEAGISFLLMSAVLVSTNHPRLSRRTPLLVAALVALFIAFESPLSGMSMNPARSLASALAGGDWRDLWIYLVAPPLGMLLAAEVYVRRRGRARVLCAKLHHHGESPCIFACRFGR